LLSAKAATSQHAAPIHTKAAATGKHLEAHVIFCDRAAKFFRHFLYDLMDRWR